MSGVSSCAEVSARLEDLFMDADASGIFDKIDALARERREVGEEAGGGLWTWEMFKSLCLQEGLV